MAGQSSPVNSNSTTQNNAIISLSKIPNDVFYEIFSRLVQIKNIHPLFLTSKHFHHILSTHIRLLKQIIPIYFPHTFILNPKTRHLKALFDQLTIIDKNIRAKNFRKNEPPQRPFHWAKLQKEKCISSYTGNLREAQHENTLFIGQRDGNIKVVDLSSGKVLRDFAAHRKMINGIVVHNRKLISCSADGTVKVWDPNNLNTGKELKIFTPNHNSGAVVCMAVHGNTIYCGGISSIKTCDLELGTTDHFCTTSNPVYSLAVEEETLCFSSNDNILEIWNANSRKRLSQHLLQEKVQNGSNSLTRYFILQDGKLVFNDPFGNLAIWDANLRKQLACLNVSDNPVSCFSMQNGKLYYSIDDEPNEISLLDFNFPDDMGGNKNGN